MVAYKWLKFAYPKRLQFIIKKFINKNPFPFIAGILVGTSLTALYDEYDVGSIHAKSDYSSRQDIFEKYGLPNNLVTLCYSNHQLQYDFQKRIPLWVGEHITKDTLYGTAERQQCSFRADKNIPEKFQSKNEDYLASGYTRGHMMPAGDIKSNQEAMNETFFLSNIIPQDLENNAGFWFRMETYCRALVKKYSDVYVISGPLFIPTSTSESEIKVVTYKVIGDNCVAVPSHLYKVILAENMGKPMSIAAFVVPNKQIDEDATLRDHEVSLDELERLAGIEFFPQLRLKRIKRLCDVEGCNMISKKTADLWHLSRSIKKAVSIEELDKVFSDINKKKIQVDKKFMDLYWEKKNKFKNGQIVLN